jgi:hypothetical protein
MCPGAAGGGHVAGVVRRIGAQEHQPRPVRAAGPAPARGGQHLTQQRGGPRAEVTESLRSRAAAIIGAAIGVEA